FATDPELAAGEVTGLDSREFVEAALLIEAVGVEACDERIGKSGDDALRCHLEVAAGVTASDVAELADGLEQGTGPLGALPRGAVGEGEGERELVGGMGDLAVEQRRGPGVLPRTRARVHRRLMEGRVKTVGREANREIHPQDAVPLGRFAL